MTCATLYVVSKIVLQRQDLKQTFFGPAIKVEGDHDVHEVDDSDTEDVRVMGKVKEKTEENTIMLTNVAIGDTSQTKPDEVKEEENDVKTETQDSKVYDPFGRNPLYAGAMREINIELEALAKHFHPSVALFANQIIQGTRDL